MDERRREALKRMAQEQVRKRGSKGEWVLVDVRDSPVLPGVEQVRNEWEGEEIWFRMPKSGIWRRGKVKEVQNYGAVVVVVYQKGLPGGGLWLEFDMQQIPVYLRHAEG